MSEIKSEVRSEVMTSEPAEQRAYVESLIIEITRHCNMRCAHCLRGDAQDMDISKESLDKIFQPVESVGTLTFTGGEPALRPQLLMDALEAAKRHHTMVERVYIVMRRQRGPRRVHECRACMASVCSGRGARSTDRDAGFP